MGLSALLDRTLRNPAEALAALRRDETGAWGGLLVVAVVGLAGFGLLAGSFQGGMQVLVTAGKAPLIVLGSLLLCLPSLWVFTGLVGAEVSPAVLRGVVSVFAALLALVLVALAPVAWLFSVSSSSLVFVVLLHLIVWILAVGLAKPVLGEAFPGESARAVVRLWLAIFVLVSLQVTTYVRPVLVRVPDAPLVAPEKMFFLEHFRRIANGEEGALPEGAQRGRLGEASSLIEEAGDEGGRRRGLVASGTPHRRGGDARGP